MTYNRVSVLAAANRVAQNCRARRREVLIEYDSQNIFLRFLSALVGEGRPDYYRVGEQKLAERISFKMTICNESSVELTDQEIDTIREYWG